MNKMIENQPAHESQTPYKPYLFPKIDHGNQNDDQLCKNKYEANFERLQDNNHMSSGIFENSIHQHQSTINGLSENDHSYHQGLQDGREEGSAIEKEKLKMTINHFKNALEDLNQMQANAVKDLEKQISMLSIAIAEKVIDKEVSIDKSIIQNLLVNILNSIEDRKDIKIRINPTDLDIVQENGHDLKGIEGMEFISDSSITIGGCLIETGSGDIDARIENRLKMIEDAFTALNVTKSD